jgi:hydrogenase maturation factor
MNLEQVLYALAKQVPHLQDYVELHTGYGRIVLHDDDAARVAAVVQQILQEKYRRLRAEEDAAE